jgi:peptide-methionine (S)-S-oxide reductase
VHLRTHSASRSFVAEGKYRSAIYIHDEAQEKRAVDTIGALQSEFENPIETRVLRFRKFKPSDERYQNYYATDPERPFCRRFIDPKLDFLRRNFAEIMSPHGASE